MKHVLYYKAENESYYFGLMSYWGKKKTENLLDLTTFCLIINCIRGHPNISIYYTKNTTRLV